MIRKILFPLISFVLVCIISGCSTKKDAFLNRKYHAMTTEYNILYNGNLAFQRGLDEINLEYEDNYWEILPIEPLNLEEEKLFVPDYKIKSNSSKNKNEEEDEVLTDFELAEEKAVKAVQKHSMKIGGKEKNSRIDEAYLLLGKSRYYTSRFVPATDAFNYVIRNYPDASLINETFIWKAKTSIRMQNEETAILILEAVLQNEELSQENLEDTYITMAMAYRQVDSTYFVIKNLDKAVKASKNPEKKARNLFILGQLYRQENQINKSQSAFQEIIDFKKAPYKYKIHAEIERVKNYVLSDVPQNAIPELEKLIEIRENRPYLDELYYHLAMLQEKSGDENLALLNYQNSVQAKGAKDFQKGLSYEASGNIYFDETNYIMASKFYDSVIQVSKNNDSKRIRQIIRKKQGLESVVAFENIIHRNDSISYVLSMSRQDQSEYYSAYIEQLKINDKEAEEEARFLEGLKRYESSGLASAQTSMPSNKNGEWYFYSDQTVAYGQQEFKRVWGVRTAIDNWRWSDTSILRDDENIHSIVDKSNEEEGIPEAYQLVYYLNQLPDTEREIDSISDLRNNTYYKLGVIYKEQFDEYELAAETLERLVDMNPDDKLMLGSKYHLHKIYKTLGNEVKAYYYGNEVVTDYPESVFAQMLSNPNGAVEKAGAETPEGKYREIYMIYKSRDYVKTIFEVSNALRIFEGTPIVPKMELLKAYAIGKTEGKKAFLEALNHIVLNYSNTDEGKKAKELIRKLK